MTQERHHRLLEAAVQKFGRDGLARRLNIPPRWVDYWLQRRVSLPARRVQDLVDLLSHALRRDR